MNLFCCRSRAKTYRINDLEATALEAATDTFKSATDEKMARVMIDASGDILVSTKEFKTRIPLVRRRRLSDITGEALSATLKRFQEDGRGTLRINTKRASLLRASLKIIQIKGKPLAYIFTLPPPASLSAPMTPTSPASPIARHQRSPSTLIPPSGSDIQNQMHLFGNAAQRTYASAIRRIEEGLTDEDTEALVHSALVFTYEQLNLSLCNLSPSLPKEESLEKIIDALRRTTEKWIALKPNSDFTALDFTIDSALDTLSLCLSPIIDLFTLALIDLLISTQRGHFACSMTIEDGILTITLQSTPTECETKKPSSLSSTSKGAEEPSDETKSTLSSATCEGQLHHYTQPGSLKNIAGSLQVKTEEGKTTIILQCNEASLASAKGAPSRLRTLTPSTLPSNPHRPQPKQLPPLETRRSLAQPPLELLQLGGPPSLVGTRDPLFPRLSAASAPEPLPQEDLKQLNGLKVLIVDDESINRRIMERFFKQFQIAGSTVEYSSATSGEDAVKIAKEMLPDIILMDIQMPGISGVEATQQIRQWIEEEQNGRMKGRHMLIIPSTGNATPADLNKYQEKASMNIEFFLQKPFNARDVLARLSQASSHLNALSQKPSSTGEIKEDK